MDAKGTVFTQEIMVSLCPTKIEKLGRVGVRTIMVLLYTGGRFNEGNNFDLTLSLIEQVYVVVCYCDTQRNTD